MNRAPGLLLVALLGACASLPPRDAQVRADMATGRYRDAAETAARAGDELLRHLDRGMVLFYAGDHRGSNLYFARAEHLAEERYTRSVGMAALSLLMNDTVLPYQPDPCERLLVPLYRALNHVSAGEPVDAAVEARRLASLLLERRDTHPERAVREGDAFLSYMAGVLFEWAERPAEAHVAYRNAAESYRGAADPSPASSPGDGVRDGGELALLLEDGFVAAPVEERIFLLVDSGDLELGRRDPEAAGEALAKRYLGRSAAREVGEAEGFAYLLPVSFRRRPAPVLPPANVTAEVGGLTLTLPVVFDLSQAAALQEEAELAAVLAKTIARAVAKTLIFKEMTDREGAVVRAVANAVHLATEKADLRAWLTLPAEIRFLRVPLPAGEHELRVRFSTAAGPRMLELPDVQISAGRLTIVTARLY